MATFAEVFGAEIPANAGEDSVSLIPLLNGGREPVRDHAVSHSVKGLPTLRRGSWKMIFGPGSGGWTKGGPSSPTQLYKLDEDLGETNNLSAAHPELVTELTALMEQIVSKGRSTPGTAQKNDVPVNWKRFLQGKPAAKTGKR